MISDGDAPTNRTKPTEEGGSERPRMPPHAGRIGRSQTSPFPMNSDRQFVIEFVTMLVITIDARTQVHHNLGHSKRPDRSLKADRLDERSTPDGAAWINGG